MPRNDYRSTLHGIVDPQVIESNGQTRPDNSVAAQEENVENPNNTELLDNTNVSPNGLPDVPAPDTSTKVNRLRLNQDTQTSQLSPEEKQKLEELAGRIHQPIESVVEMLQQTGLSVNELDHVIRNPETASANANARLEAFGLTSKNAASSDHNNDAEQNDDADAAALVMIADENGHPGVASTQDMTNSPTSPANTGNDAQPMSNKTGPELATDGTRNAALVPESSTGRHGRLDTLKTQRAELTTSPAPTSSSKTPQNDSIVPS